MKILPEINIHGENIMNIPNILTGFRAITSATVAGIIGYSWPNPFLGIPIALGFVSDAADGYLARKLDQETEFGKRFDAATDAFSTLAILSSLAYSTPDSTQRGILIGVLVTTLGYIIHLCTEWRQLGNLQDEIGRSRIGQWKTGINMVAMTILSISPHDWSMYSDLGNIVGTTGILWGTFMTGICWRDYHRKGQALLQKIRNNPEKSI